MLIEAFTTITHGALAAALSPEQREASGKLPVRLKLLSWGTNESVKGPIVLDVLSADRFAAEQRRRGKERVAIDFEHNTLPGTAAYEEAPEPRKVAGYGSPRVIPGDGLYLEDIAWTPAGIAEALNFEDISPAPYLDDERRVTGLHSTALVRNGAVEGLHFFSAEEPAPTQPTEKSMNDEEKAELKALRESVESLSAGLKALSEKVEGLSAGGDTTDVEALSASVTALSGTIEGMQRDAIVDAATREGKVIPLSAEEIADTPVPRLKSLVDKLEGGVVPLSAATRDRKPESHTASAALESVAKVTGFSVEQLRSGDLNPKKEND